MIFPGKLNLILNRGELFPAEVRERRTTEWSESCNITSFEDRKRLP